MDGRNHSSRDTYPCYYNPDDSSYVTVRSYYFCCKFLCSALDKQRLRKQYTLHSMFFIMMHKYDMGPKSGCLIHLLLLLIIIIIIIHFYIIHLFSSLFDNYFSVRSKFTLFDLLSRGLTICLIPIVLTRFNVAGTKQLFLLSFTIPVTLWVVSCSCLAMSSKVRDDLESRLCICVLQLILSLSC